MKALFKGAVGSTPPCEGGAIGTSSGVMTCANGASEIENRGRWAYIWHSGSARADTRVNGGSYEDRTLPPVAALLATTSQGGACAITQRCCPGAFELGYAVSHGPGRPRGRRPLRARVCVNADRSCAGAPGRVSLRAARCAVVKLAAAERSRLVGRVRRPRPGTLPRGDVCHEYSSVPCYRLVS